MKHTCILIDDEYPARELLESYILKFPNLDLIGKFGSPLEAIPILHKVDIMFIDIQMPDLSGIDFLKTLSTPPLFVFTTAYAEYAVEGFELSAVDYLVKPFSFQRFAQSVHKTTDRLQTPRTSSPQPSTPSKEILPIKSDGKVHKVYIEDILYIEGLKAYVSFFTKQGRLIGLYSMKELENKVSSKGFVRIHKSYIINLDAIESIDPNFITIGNKSIPIGASYKDTLKNRLNWLKL